MLTAGASGGRDPTGESVARRAIVSYHHGLPTEAPSMLEHSVLLTSGRQLRVREEGDPKGHPVFSLHGTPGSRLNYPPIVSDAAAKGLRLISYDRPGYGASTSQPGRSVGDTAVDVAAIADALQLDRFGVWGHSGGGAPALACAALLGRRVVGAVSLSGVAPYSAEGLDWIEGTGEFNAVDFRLMLSDRVAWEAKCRRDRDEMLTWSPDQLREGLGSLLSDVDRTVLTEELLDFLIRQGREGLLPGHEGMRDDNLSDILPWGFELSQIRVPVQVWHGDHDRFVPVTHGAWLGARIPNADVHLERDEGHLSMFVRRVPVAQSWLAGRF